MKLAYFCMGAVVALTMGACSNNCGKKCTSAAGSEVVYVGTLPAADSGEGIDYQLQLSYNDDKTGDFTLTTTATDPADSTVTVTNTVNGAFTLRKGTPADAEMAFLELTPSHGDRAEDSASNQMYFLASTPTTLEMVGPTLTPSASGLNYTLTLQDDSAAK